MAYTATMGGEPLKTGTMQEVQDAVMQAVTGALAVDPDGVAMSAEQANKDFSSGTVEATVASTGEWRCPMWVHGRTRTLCVTGEG